MAVSVVPTALLLCPGRGSYGESELGCLARQRAEGDARVARLLDRMDALRARHDPDLPSLAALDEAEKFRPSLHLVGRNSAALIFAATILEAELAARSSEPVAVGGNSLGYYTSLVVSGALTLDDGWRLVSTTARLQDAGRPGGQVMWSFLDDDWQIVEDRVELLAALLDELDGFVSIRLGGHVVLAASEAGVVSLLERLPEVQVGKRKFPFRLPLHGPFHSVLASDVAERARTELEDLAITRPRVPLIDGRGHVWPPLSTNPRQLLAYTVGHQITQTFDYTSVVRVGICEFAAERTVCLGPGSTLRAPTGHVERFLAQPDGLPALARLARVGAARSR